MLLFNIRKFTHLIRKLIHLIIDATFIRALFKGVGAGYEHKAILRNLRPCNHIVDIGANRGQFALVARSCFPSARIDSFEPLKEPAAKYSKVFSGDKSAHLHPCAIGAETAEMTIHISNSDDSSSLLPIGKMQSTIFPNTQEIATTQVHVTTLAKRLPEAEIGSNALLKIDVQGYEMTTLTGCSNLLHKFKHVYVECSFIEMYEGQALASDVIHFLTGHSFTLVGVYNMHIEKTGLATQADFLFRDGQNPIDASK